MAADDQQREPANVQLVRSGGHRRMTLRLRMAALAIALAVTAPAGEAKRRPPADVPPVVVGAIRYEVPRMGTPFGDAKDGGIVVARRADSRELLWTRRVYVIVRDPLKEGDVQDVFIKTLTLTPDGKHLDIVNERGARFELDLDGSGVRTLPP